MKCDSSSSTETSRLIQDLESGTKRYSGRPCEEHPTKPKPEWLQWIQCGIALLSFCHVVINSALFYCNYCIQIGHPIVSDIMFHRTEFWSTFVFVLVQLCAVMILEKNSCFENYPSVVTCVFLANVIGSLCSAILVTIDLEYFEIVSHELEYVNEITMSFVDLFFLWSSSSSRYNHCPTECGHGSESKTSRGAADGIVRRSRTMDDRTQWLATASISCLVAIVQLSLYNGFGKNAEGDMNGELVAHYCEFLFESLSGGIMIWFSLRGGNR
jgi:hypothetical protein